MGHDDFAHKRMSVKWQAWGVIRGGDRASFFPLSVAALFCCGCASYLLYFMSSKGTQFRWMPSKRTDAHSEVNAWADAKDNGFIFGVGKDHHERPYQTSNAPPKF